MRRLGCLAAALCFSVAKGSCDGDPTYLRDGYCDSSLNIADCSWDLGDCCSESCIDGPSYVCGSNGFNCLDPDYTSSATTTSSTTTTDRATYTTTTDPNALDDDTITTLVIILVLLLLCLFAAAAKNKHGSGEEEKDLEIYQEEQANQTRRMESPSSVIQFQPNPQTARQSPHYMQTQVAHFTPHQATVHVPVQQHHQPTVHVSMQQQHQPTIHSQYEKKRTQSQPPLPKGWRSIICADGRVYYQNDITKQTQWHMPTHTIDANKQIQPAETLYDTEDQSGLGGNLQKEWNDLMHVMTSHAKFMKTNGTKVDQFIASSGNYREQLQNAKDISVRNEEKILDQIKKIAPMMDFVKDILLIENLFNKVYTADQREQQQGARKKYGANIHHYESKPKPCSKAESFMCLVFDAKNTISAFGTWLETIIKGCEAANIHVKSKSRAKEKNMPRAFYKSFYVYGRHFGEYGHLQMTDMVRCSLVFDNFDHLYACFAMIEQVMKHHGGDILRCKDRFHPKDMPLGYRDLLINIRCPGSNQNVVCEVHAQLHHQLFYKFKEQSHAVYKKARIFEDKDGNNMAYEYADKHVRENIGDAVYDTSKATSKVTEAHQLLKKWSLAEHSQVLDDKGYDEVNDWRDLTKEELCDMGFKEGHAKRFMRLVSEQLINPVPEDKMIE
eukprot:555737_1